MSLGGGAVDTLDGGGIELDETGQDRVPDPRLRPPVEAIIDRRVGTILRGTILPATPDTKHVDDPADHLTISPWLDPAPVHRN